MDNEENIDNLRQNYRKVETIVSAKRSALELIANIIGGSGVGASAGDDDNDDDEDMEYSDGDGIDDNTGAVVESDDIDDEDIEQLVSTLNPQIETMILAIGLVDKIGQHLCPLDGQLRGRLAVNGFGTEIIKLYVLLN